MSWGAAVKVAIEEVELKLTRPFESNMGVKAHVTQLHARVELGGSFGLGMAVFEGAVSTLDTDLSELRRHLAGAETPHVALERIQGRGVPAVRAAVDMALHDLWARSLDLPLHRALGLDSAQGRAVALSLGNMEETELLRQVEGVAHWPILKLKLGGGTDPGRVARVRARYDGRIWVDGNGAWNVEQAIAVSRMLADQGVELLEQPVRSREELRAVAMASPVPIVADESISSAEDVIVLSGSVAGVNIKLNRCGGIFPALRLIRAARDAGLRIMLGCKTESVAGVTASAHLGALADDLDLDGHLDIADDIYRGVGIDEGILRMPAGAGLGIQDRRERTWRR
jgi:L-Ala-D/L-Glu epimerase